MPNGGSDHCANCRHYRMEGLQRGEPRWRDGPGLCAIRGIVLDIPVLNYCANHYSDAAAPIGPIFRGFSEGGQLHECRIPWHGEQRPAYAGGASCEICRRPFVRGIEVTDAGRLLKFCGVGHYLQWWKRVHPGEPLAWDYPDALGKPFPEAKMRLPVTVRASESSFARLAPGPLATEHGLWHLAYEDPWLCVDRFSGECLFWLRFEKHGSQYRSAEAWMTRDPEVMSQPWIAQLGGESAQVNAAYLEAILFRAVHGRAKSFPVPLRARLVAAQPLEPIMPARFFGVNKALAAGCVTVMALMAFAALHDGWKVLRSPAPFSWTSVLGVAVLAGIAALFCVLLVYLNKTAVSVDAEGLWKSALGKRRGLLPWSAIKRVRERSGYLELLGDGEKLLMPVWEHLAPFSELRSIILARAQQPPIRYPVRYQRPTITLAAIASGLVFAAVAAVTPVAIAASTFLAIPCIIALLISGALLAVELCSPRSVTISAEELTLQYWRKNRKIPSAEIKAIGFVDVHAKYGSTSQLQIELKTGEILILSGIGVDDGELYRALRALRPVA